MPLTPQAHRSAASSHPDNQQQPAAASDAISEHDQVLLYLQQLLSNPPAAPPGTVPNLLGVTITIRQQDLEPAWAPSLPGGLSFKLQDFIGKGGFGAVYRAVSDSLPIAAPQSNLGIPQHLSSAAMATYGSFSGISGLAPTAAAGTGCNNSSSSSSSSSRNTAYAVKVCLEPAQHEAWEREVRVLQKLGHVPGCLQLLGQATLVSTTGTALQCMVTPLHLGSLTQLLQAYVKQFGRSLHVSTIQDIIKQLLTILHKLHSGACGGHVILHLDIKASNILLDLVKGRWIVTLADYGISNAVMAQNPAEAATTAHGFSQYSSSPSINRKQPVDACSDVWSVAVLAVEVAVGGKQAFNEVVPLQYVHKNAPVRYGGYREWCRQLEQFAAGELWADRCVGSKDAVRLMPSFVGACCSCRKPLTVEQLLGHP